MRQPTAIDYDLTEDEKKAALRVVEAVLEMLDSDGEKAVDTQALMNELSPDAKQYAKEVLIIQLGTREGAR